MATATRTRKAPAKVQETVEEVEVQETELTPKQVINSGIENVVKATGVDTQKARYKAMRAIAQVLAFAGVTDPDAPAVYSQINKSYWRKLERGEVTTAFLRVARFRDFAERYGVNIDPEALADEFVRALSMQRELIPGALERVTATPELKSRIKRVSANCDAEIIR